MSEQISFLGNIEANADAKGRVFLPAPFRKVLQGAGEEVLVLRKHFHQPCLVLYPMSAWKQRTGKILERVNEFDKESDMLFRVFVADAEELTLDGNGRFLISARLQKMADIKKSVHFIGVNDTIEIWASEKLEQPFLSQEDFSAKLQALMATPPINQNSGERLQAFQNP